jgi:two-component system sensor histidine kinase YesM
MIEALSTLMDGALGRDGRSQIPLRDELQVVDAYLYIIRERLGERLVITREIDPQMMDTPVPRLILQPLAENAVEHDLTPRRGGCLTLRARREADRIILEVEHDGHMNEEDRAAVQTLLSAVEDDPAVSSHVGLRNVRQRLRLLYGEAGELSLTEDDGRILARVSFPADP